MIYGDYMHNAHGVLQSILSIIVRESVRVSSSARRQYGTRVGGDYTVGGGGDSKSVSGDSSVVN